MINFKNKYSEMNREELSKLKIDIDNKVSSLSRKERDLVIYYYNLKQPKLWKKNNFLFIINIVEFSVMYISLLLNSVIEFSTYCIIVFVSALFYTKMETDATELQNEIFELKEMLKDKTICEKK